MMRIPTHRTPTRPGEMLAEEFLGPLGLTQRQLADVTGVPYQRVNEIVRGRRGGTPSTALRLARFRNTSPGFWLHLQLRRDLFRVQQCEEQQLKRILPYAAANEAVAS